MINQEFIEKMLHWKPVFGDRNNGEIARLMSEFNLAYRREDFEEADKLQKKIEFYL